MSDVVAIAPNRPVLADVIPKLREHSVVLVIGGAMLMGLASQIKVPLGFTPVPINLATFAAVLVGGALGMRRGAAAMGLFLAVGLVGVPWFAGGNSGWEYATGATGGYLLMYPVMAAVVGYAAQRGLDRNVAAFVAVIVAANLALYAVGTLWLAHVLDVPVLGWESSGFTMGVRPFLAGDVAKMVAAGLLFPAAWRFTGTRS